MSAPVKLPRDTWTIAVCPTCGVAQADGSPVNGAGKLTCSGWRTPEQDVHERVECVPVTVTSVEVSA